MADVADPGRTYTLSVSEEQTQQEQSPERVEPSGEDCELCGVEMFGLHCKLVCPNCGYRRDCSDP
jgi:hypothetical protein